MAKQDGMDTSEPPGGGGPEKLELLELESLPGDERLLATAFQGLINRLHPRLYLLHGRQEEKERWLREFQRPYLTHDGVTSLMSHHPEIVKGLIIYDPTVPDSINVAVTLAGLEQGLPASPELAHRLGGQLSHVPTLADLRGRFSILKVQT